MNISTNPWKLQHIELSSDRAVTRLFCTICKDKFSFSLPCSLSVAGVIFKTFGDDHEKCLKKWTKERLLKLAAAFEGQPGVKNETEEKT